MKDAGFFNLIGSFPALLLVLGYFALGIFCARKIRALAGVGKRPRLGTLFSAFILAVFFAQGIVAFGTGTEVGIGPAPVWMTVLQSIDIPHKSFLKNVRWAIISFSVTWALLFVVGLFHAHAKTGHLQIELAGPLP